jgi:pimeloyl-ACP methyl ester carboxylesterase
VPLTNPVAVRTARLSTARLRPVDNSIPPWPGETVRLGDADVYVRRTPGPLGGGEPALYVHGLGGASTNWTDLAHLLSDRLDGEAIDLPGFGHSGPAPGRDYSITRSACVVIRLLQSQRWQQDRGPVHLFGNSMGGAISVIVAAARPDLVRTLTLISPAMPDLRVRRGSDPTLPLLLVPGLHRIAERRLRQMSPERRARAVIELCFANPDLVPPNRMAEAAEEVRRRADLPWAMDAFTASLRALAFSYLSRGRRSLWQLARQITMPTLVIWGDQDQLVDVALAPRTARTVRDGRLLVLPGVGHTAQLEDPTSVARAFLGLLEDVESASPNATEARAGGGDGGVMDGAG